MHPTSLKPFAPAAFAFSALLTCLKLGISTGLYGLTLTNLLNDVMLGEPEIRPAPVGLGVIALFSQHHPGRSA